MIGNAQSAGEEIFVIAAGPLHICITLAEWKQLWLETLLTIPWR